MPLTPADVHNVAFKKPSIGKRGYDEDEVDAFLDVVEAELSRLIEENDDLTSRLAAYESGGTAPAARPAEAAPVAAPAAAARGCRRRRQRHVQAARLLGLAQETADRLTEEAKAESEKTAGRRQEPVRGADQRRHHQGRGRRAGQPDQGRGARRGGQGPVRRGAGQAGRRAGRPGEEDRGPAQLRAGVPRPAEELDQRSAGAARRRGARRSRRVRSPTDTVPAGNRSARRGTKSVATGVTLEEQAEHLATTRPSPASHSEERDHRPPRGWSSLEPNGSGPSQPEMSGPDRLLPERRASGVVPRDATDTGRASSLQVGRLQRRGVPR